VRTIQFIFQNLINNDSNGVAWPGLVWPFPNEALYAGRRQTSGEDGCDLETGQTKVTVTVDHDSWILLITSKEERFSSSVSHWIMERVYNETHCDLNSFHGFRAVTAALETKGLPIDNSSSSFTCNELLITGGCEFD
jgi:hypothetical protein